MALARRVRELVALARGCDWLRLVEEGVERCAGGNEAVVVAEEETPGDQGGGVVESAGRGVFISQALVPSGLSNWLPIVYTIGAQGDLLRSTI